MQAKFSEGRLCISFAKTLPCRVSRMTVGGVGFGDKPLFVSLIRTKLYWVFWGVFSRLGLPFKTTIFDQCRCISGALSHFKCPKETADYSWQPEEKMVTINKHGHRCLNVQRWTSQPHRATFKCPACLQTSRAAAHWSLHEDLKLSTIQFSARVHLRIIIPPFPP